MKIKAALGLGLLVGFFTINQVLAAGVAAQLRTIERAVNAAEAFEAGGTMSGVRDHDELKQVAEGLKKAAPELEAYLERNADDVGALLLKARLLRLQQIMTPIRVTHKEGRPTIHAEMTPDEIHATLDRALALAPDNAEAHYWKARLYGLRVLTVVDNKLTYRQQMEKALHFARRAVRLAPTNRTYRDALVLYLLGEARKEEAMEILRGMAGEEHPLYRLLADQQRFPVPNGAVLNRSLSEMMIQMYFIETRLAKIYTYPGQRYAAYWVAKSASEVETFLRKRWDNLKVSVQAPAVRSTILEWKGIDLYPSDIESEAFDHLSDYDPPGSFLLITVIENQKPQRKNIPISFVDVVSTVSFMNLRKFKSPASGARVDAAYPQGTGDPDEQ